MELLLLTGGGLLAAAWGYTRHLSKIRAEYEPDNTHWAAFWGIALIEVAYLVLCLAGPLPILGDLPVEGWWAHFALCWIAYIPILRWREREKRAQQSKRGK